MDTSRSNKAVKEARYPEAEHDAAIARRVYEYQWLLVDFNIPRDWIGPLLVAFQNSIMVQWLELTTEVESNGTD